MLKTKRGQSNSGLDCVVLIVCSGQNDKQRADLDTIWTLKDIIEPDTDGNGGEIQLLLKMFSDFSIFFLILSGRASGPQ